MSVAEYLRIAAKQTKKHPMRSMLTILGIVIGIAVMTAVLSVGDAGQARIRSELDKFGMNRILIYADDYESFRLSDTERLAGRIRGITGVAGQSFWKGSVKAQRASVVCEVIGTSENIREVENKEMSAGRFINGSDNSYARFSAVIGEECARELFGTGQPVGEKIRIEDMTFTVVGVEKNTKQIYNAVVSHQIYIPITTYEDVFGGGVQQISFEVTDREDISKTVDDVTGLLYESYGGTISVLDLSEQIENADGILDIVRLVMGAVAVMSLLVGGIGIMNIMLVTVRERKKEIGLRKALGAKDGDILKQFLSEAVMYSIIGAAAGVVIGMLMTASAERVIGLETSISLPSLGIAIGFSVAVGVAAGILPAVKAAKLDPVEALRSE